jgi:hypothetical protein
VAGFCEHGNEPDGSIKDGKLRSTSSQEGLFFVVS